MPEPDEPDSRLSFLIEKVGTSFCRLFGPTRELGVAAAPGRVNLIGEHTDYNEGFVLPMAVDRYVAVAFGSNELGLLRAHSLDFVDSRDHPLAGLAPTRRSSWFDYVAGVLWALAEEGSRIPGLDIVVGGTVPIGAGIASSAALELAVARAAAAVAGQPWDGPTMARTAQRAENVYVGVACGIMDQIAAACSREGCALLLDCRSLETTPVPLPPACAVVVMDTATRRSLADGAYNERRRSCEEAVAVLRQRDPSIRALRDVAPNRLDESRDALGAVAFRRARHVVWENSRVGEMAAALANGDPERAGFLMNESHRSLVEDYEVSTDALDRIAAIARRHHACWGARMTGAGFGGCGVALVRAEQAEAFRVDVEAAYRAETRLPGVLDVCLAVGGADLWAASG